MLGLNCSICFETFLDMHEGILLINSTSLKETEAVGRYLNRKVGLAVAFVMNGLKSSVIMRKAV